MADLPIILGVWTYDRTRALFDGSVKPQGIALTCRTAENVGVIMARALKGEFDVLELGFTYYLRSLEQANRPFIAIPVFPNRFFRHSSVFIHTASGIAAPKDLIGKKVGELHRYGHDAGIWAKGALADDFGVPADAMTYYVGGLDAPVAAPDWAQAAVPPSVTVHDIGPAKTLDAMLEAGEIAALFSANMPPPFLKGSPKVARLFPNFEMVERDYFQRTRIFPIMHTVVMKRGFYEANRWIAAALCRAFQSAKDSAAGEYRATERHFGARYMVPWLIAQLERNRALMGEDLWPYGVEANRKTIDACLRYHHEQGITRRRWQVDEIFAPETLG
jgi:hypothetical protein